MPLELVLRTIGMLGLLGAVWWYVKRRMPRNLGSQDLRVVTRTGIGRGSVVAVIEVEGRTFLVGATDQSITLLSELEGAPAAQPEDVQQTPSRPRMDLVRHLQRMTLRRPNHRRPPRVLRS